MLLQTSVRHRSLKLCLTKGLSRRNSLQRGISAISGDMELICLIKSLTQFAFGVQRDLKQEGREETGGGRNPDGLDCRGKWSRKDKTRRKGRMTVTWRVSDNPVALGFTQSSFVALIHFFWQGILPSTHLLVKWIRSHPRFFHQHARQLWVLHDMRGNWFGPIKKCSSLWRHCDSVFTETTAISGWENYTEIWERRRRGGYSEWGK